MLVLSRRPHETVVFPTLGITIEVAHVQGKLVKLGIAAPREIPVLRGELSHSTEYACQAAAPWPANEHTLRNLLNRSQLAIHLAQQQLASGLDDDASQSLNKAIAELESLEQRCELKSQPQNGSSHSRALLVDDDRNEGELLAGIMRMNGFSVELAGDGREALDVLNSGPRPDLVLLDMLMPKCNGAETIRAIRADRRFAGLKVFAVSGASPMSLGVEPGPEGCDRWFPKPVRPEALMREIRREMEAAAPHLGPAC